MLRPTGADQPPEGMKATTITTDTFHEAISEFGGSDGTRNPRSLVRGTGRALCHLSIRMVAGFAETAERKEILVAGGGFEPPTFGL